MEVQKRARLSQKELAGQLMNVDTDHGRECNWRGSERGAFQLKCLKCFGKAGTRRFLSAIGSLAVGPGRECLLPGLSIISLLYAYYSTS